MKILSVIIFFLLITGFRENGKFQLPLSKKEEEKYIHECYDLKSSAARDILIERNLRLVANIAIKYVNNTNSLEDLISIGTIGLIKGIDTYRNDKNNKLSTYISKCIENEILMHFRKEKRTGEELYLEDIKCLDKDGNGVRFIDVIESEEEAVDDRVYDNLTMQLVEKIFPKVLNDTEQLILKKRYGIFGCEKETQEKIAKELNISRSYVSRIEKAALFKLNKNLKKTKF